MPRQMLIQLPVAVRMAAGEVVRVDDQPFMLLHNAGPDERTFKTTLFIEEIDETPDENPPSGTVG